MKKIILTSITTFLAFFLFAQKKDTIFYYINGLGQKVDPKNSTYLRVGLREDTIWHVFDLYLIDDKVRMEFYSKDDSLKIKEGSCVVFSKEGKIISKGNYQKGKEQGLWKWWYENGSLKDSIVYKNGIPTGESVGWYEDGKKLYRKFFDNDGKGNGFQSKYYYSGILRDSGGYEANKRNGLWTYYRTDQTKASEIEFMNDSVIAAKNFDNKGQLTSAKLIEKEAAYKSGENGWNNYLSQKVSSINQMQNREMYKGSCNILFAIDSDGSVINIEVVEHNNEELANLVISFISASKKWNPAIQYNLPVKAWRIQRITFSPE